MGQKTAGTMPSLTPSVNTSFSNTFIVMQEYRLDVDIELTMCRLIINFSVELINSFNNSRIIGGNFMGSWDFENIGYSCSNGKGEQVEKLLRCIGVDFDVDDYETSVINEMFQEAEMGENHSSMEIAKIYAIVNKLFGETTIFFEGESGSNTSDFYYRYEEIYDPKTNSIYIGEMDYDYGEGTAFNVSPYKLIKYECEMVAKERNIPIQWDIRDCGDLRPTGDEFSELCEEIYDKHGGLEGLGTKQKKQSIPKISISKADIDKIITSAKSCGYDDLIELIKKTF